MIPKYQKKWIKENPEKWRAIQKRYRESHKEKIRIRNLKWYRKNSERINQKRKEKYKKWRETHPYKITPHGNGWGTMRLKVLARDNCICQICGKDAQEVHHLDGTGSNRKRKEMNNNLNNLITVCHRCHIRLEILKGGDFSKGKWEEDEERNETIIKMLGKFSQSRISRMMGITRQRVNQIVKKSRKIEISL